VFVDIIVIGKPWASALEGAEDCSLTCLVRMDVSGKRIAISLPRDEASTLVCLWRNPIPSNKSAHVTYTSAKICTRHLQISVILYTETYKSA
jgi:hypothetical protein